MDVLNSRRSVFIAETNYLRSRYDYLLNGLRLKQAAGTLTTDDITQIDTLLTVVAVINPPGIPPAQSPFN